MQNLLSLAVLMLAPWFQQHWASPATLFLGMILILIGALLGLSGVRALGNDRTARPQPLKSAKLVTSGVYQYVRHPLYSSLIWASLGWALFWASWPALGAAVVLAALLIAKARREESLLTLQFPGYNDYAERVKRFVPWLF